MKKFLFTIIGAGYILAGCNKGLLDTKPEDKYYESDFWVTPEAANAGLSGCYAVLRRDGVYGAAASSTLPLFEETASPNAYSYGNNNGYNSIATGQQMPSTPGVIQLRWGACYSGIGRCNTLMAKIDDVKMDADTRKRMKAEARFLRAFYYFMLQNYYGGVPVILDAPDPATQSDLPRADRSKVIERIMIDLDSAALVLPLKYGKDDRGRATKGAALGLKARVLLYEASPLFNTAKDNNKWKLAADAAQAVMNMASSAGYDLFENYREMFLPANENNSEVLFDVQYMYPDQANAFDLICRQYNSNAPLLDIAQAYQMKNGLPITDPASGYNPSKPYDNRDPRMYGYLVFPGDTFMNVKVTNSRFALTGFGAKKFSIYDKPKPPDELKDLKDMQSETNFIILRYADILLMYAEATNEFSGPDQSVYNAVNKVRARVKMPALPPGLSKEQMREAIRYERRVEFAGEAQHYNDIRRWKTAEIVLNATIYNYKGAALETRKFNPARDYWWPIPQAERDLNPNLEQNPNY